MAAAIVTVASEVVILVGSYWLMRRYFGFFPVPRTLTPAVAVAAAMGGLLWLIDGAPLPVLVPLGAAVYGGLLWLISPASRELVSGLRGSVAATGLSNARGRAGRRARTRASERLRRAGRRAGRPAAQRELALGPGAPRQQPAAGEAITRSPVDAAPAISTRPGRR